MVTLTTCLFGSVLKLLLSLLSYLDHSHGPEDIPIASMELCCVGQQVGSSKERQDTKVDI